MIHRLAVILGSVAAAAILAIGFAATGLGPTAAPANAEQLDLASVTDPAVLAAPATPAASIKPITRVETTTVYVRPAPKPKVIHVTKRAPTPAATQRPKVKVVHVTKVVPSKHHGDDEGDDDGHEHDGGGEHDGGDD